MASKLFHKRLICPIGFSYVVTGGKCVQKGGSSNLLLKCCYPDRKLLRKTVLPHYIELFEVITMQNKVGCIGQHFLDV